MQRAHNQARQAYQFSIEVQLCIIRTVSIQTCSGVALSPTTATHVADLYTHLLREQLSLHLECFLALFSLKLIYILSWPWAVTRGNHPGHGGRTDLLLYSMVGIGITTGVSVGGGSELTTRKNLTRASIGPGTILQDRAVGRAR